MQKRRTGIQTYRRQLRRVTDQNNLALHTGTYKGYQIIKQITGTESGACLLLTGIYADQRHFIDNEKRLLILVGSQRELPESVTSDRLLTIYMLMDCICRLTGI